MNHLFEGYHAYGEYLQTAGKSSHTMRAYLQDLRAFVARYRLSNGEDFSPLAVDPRDITEYRGYLLRTGARPATVNGRLISLRRLFKWAHRRRLVDENPFPTCWSETMSESKVSRISPQGGSTVTIPDMDICRL